MNKHRKHTLPSLAEAEKQRFHRLIRQKPAPYPARPRAERADGEDLPGGLERQQHFPVTRHYMK